ncbi:hypothetical protein A79_1939 [Vibrio parahaemolyticus AQ3810]|nr:hypothetical protein A79_1939 [Vibrio parahaemolyticus AQ3810]
MHFEPEVCQIAGSNLANFQIKEQHNALLRGEQRNIEAAASHLKH